MLTVSSGEETAAACFTAICRTCCASTDAVCGAAPLMHTHHAQRAQRTQRTRSARWKTPSSSSSSFWRSAEREGGLNQASSKSS